MSDKDFDWNDDLDFESLADEADLGAGYAEGDESFAELGDLADYADSPEDGPTVGAEDLEEDLSGAEDMEPAAPAAAPVGMSRGNAVAAGGLGFLVAAIAMVGALGLGAAVTFVSGMGFAQLLDFSGVTAPDQILNFQTYPQNMLYLGVLGVLVLSLLGAAVVARVAGAANRRIHQSEELLDRITALRLDEEEPWSAELFKAHPDTAAFVSDVLGAWRLNQARQVKSVALEGELRRLDKAVRGGNRADLADRYDHPLVGGVADTLAQWYDEREGARQDLAAVREANEAGSDEIMGLIQEACSWNRTGAQGVEVQAATLKRWAEKFTTLARENKEDPVTREVAAGLQGLQRDLNRELEAGKNAQAISLDDLVDRGSKLAFQIAMEVARLGPRGERLLPMSQSLEELTTQFRQAVSSGKDGDESVVNPRALLTRIEQISVNLAREGAGGGGSLARTLEDLAPAALKVAGNLDQIAQSFEQQDKRLDKLGNTFGELAGVPFDPEQVPLAAPSAPAEGGLGISQSDPFGKESLAGEKDTLEVDPFGGTPTDSPLGASPLAGSPLDLNDTPGSGNGLEIEQFGFGDAVDAPVTEVEEFAQPQPEAAPVVDPGLSSDEEKVYDLAEFGAVRIDESEDRIYDLAEFGAVALS